MPDTLAIVPARGGSKRIPRKNIRPMLGQPAITWPIAALVANQRVDRVYVSTDDEGIADVARAAGAAIPFMRDPQLADDHTGLRPVVVDACDRMGVDDADLVLCVLPTAVLLDGGTINTLLDAHARCNNAFAFLAAPYSHPPQRGFILDPEGHPAMVYPEHAGTRTQDLPTLWHDTGTAYAARAGVWRSGAPVFGGTSVAVAVQPHTAIDIDTEADWDTAEALLAWRLRRPCT
jgi:N-acylneuraminate cytidylyltransferase